MAVSIEYQFNGYTELWSIKLHVVTKEYPITALYVFG